MANPVSLILLDGVIATGAGVPIGNGQQMAFSNGAGRNRNKFNWTVHVRAKLYTTGHSIFGVGGTATIQFQTSDNGSSYTTRHTEVMTILSTSQGYQVAMPNSNGDGVIFVVKGYRYFRLNVSAMSGGVPTAGETLTLDSWASVVF